MKLTITSEAIQWFEDNVGLPEGNGIRFKAKIYGNSPVNKGYGLAIEPNTPHHVAAEVITASGWHFFIEESDVWFFDNHDLEVRYDAVLDEPKYIYLKEGKAIND